MENKTTKSEKYRDFLMAKEFVKELGLKSQREWQRYKKTPTSAQDIPYNADRYYKDKGWIDWGDFLGCEIIKHPKDRIYRSYEECKKFAQQLGIKTGAEWKEFCKNPSRPKDIPYHPNRVYQDKWEEWDIFLNKTKWLSYEDSRSYIHGLDIKSLKEWHEYVKSGNKPDEIPSNPDKTYEKDWKGWGDFLGTGKIAPIDRVFRIFEEAKEYAQSLRIKGKDEWGEYCKSGNKPEDIPSHPDRTYEKDWKGWGDFLGTGRIANKDKDYMPFEEAKEFVRKFKIKSSQEWISYCKSGQKPDEIPSNPNVVYKDEGWISYADFLGYLGNGNKWNKTNLIVFLEQMKEYIHTCSVPELLTIIESNGLYNYITKEKLKKIQETNPDSAERKQTTASIIDEITGSKSEELTQVSDAKDIISDTTVGDIINPDIKVESTDTTTASIQETTDLRVKQLKALDNDYITASLDDERVQFIITERLNNLWYDVLNTSLDIQTIQDLEFENEVPKIIQETFLNEYKEVMNLQLPNGWTYQNQPLLMQKLISYRLSQHKRYGNWSGVGAGKTIGAILAGRFVGAKNTLIITFNSTIGKEDERGWTKEIRDSFKDSKIYTKSSKNVVFDDKSYNYLVLNYETFQQKGSAQFVIDLIKRNKFDYVVLDEVQSIKQRDTSESKRREIILGLVDLVRKSNPDYYLLAMSATPVINNLVEAKSLIELIEFRDFEDIETKPNISNCIELYRRLTNCGIRYRNVGDNILKNNRYTLMDVEANHLYSQAMMIPPTDFLGQDKLLLDAKLEAVLPYINTSLGKTIIYISYVAGIDEYVYDYLTTKGFKTAVYTGSEKKFDRDSALSDFIKGNYDVLLCSKPIATGVDGLQKVSDRMIILSLPFTNSELVQLVGRINRKGSNFTDSGVDVIIPLVSMNNGSNSFRWDYRKYNTITYKETIANAAVDGIIPDKMISSREKFIEYAESALDEWLLRLKKDIVMTCDRKELEVNLFPDVHNEIERQLRLNSELQEFDRRGRTLKSENMNKEFNDNPDSWVRYHSLRRESMKNWDEIPYIEIAKKIERTGFFDESDVVIDFGCGDNDFKNHIKNKVTPVDHIAIDESVIACDMKDLSQFVEDESHDIAVFSLSLWGPNYSDYLNEAHRVLRKRGIVFIAEPTSKYKDEEEQNKLIDLLESIGFKIQEIEIREKFTYFTAMKIKR